MTPLAKGTLVEKINSVPGNDGHGDGALATVVGVFPAPDDFVKEHGYGYFVEWQDLPGVPVFISGTRIRAVDTAVRT
jgi:hypothetical protein